MINSHKRKMEEFIMRITTMGKAVLLGVGCAFCLLASGCNAGSASVSDIAADGVEEEITTKAIGESSEANEGQTKDLKEAAAQDEERAGATQDNPGERRHVLEPEVAAVVDADFIGTVWKIDVDSFYIVEETVELLEDGSILGSGVSSDADIPDSDLIQVFFDENTYFYIHTIYDGGERYEDVKASFEDLEEYVSVEMKGRFEGDIFYAEEIRIIKVP